MENTPDIQSENKQIKGSPLYGAMIAFLSSLCCILPLAAIVLGFGGLPFLLRLTTFRPYFIALSLVFMAGALWWTWRRNQNCCATDEQKHRLYLILASMTGAYLVVFLILSLALPTLINRYQGGGDRSVVSASSNVGTKNTAMRRLDLTITGMSCPSCPTTVRSLLVSKPGIKDAQFKYPDGTGYVLYDQAKIKQEIIIADLEQAGYPAKAIGERPVAK